MIHVYAFTKDHAVKTGIPLNELASHKEIVWYWVDFDCPTEEEAALLESHFRFHPLAIEDCFHFLQRPKLDYYEDALFFVLHTIHPGTLEAEEIDIFLGPHYIVTYHAKPQPVMRDFLDKLKAQPSLIGKGPLYAVYVILDKIVDTYFPTVYQIEDRLLSMDDRSYSKEILDEVFELRADLHKIRRTVFPMRDLLYRIINSDKIDGMKHQIAYFRDIHDHLLKISELIESCREMTTDIRDSYISVTSYRMNTIMKTLTVITTIFMPITFIAGIYGMNFESMPELRWRFGYVSVLALMGGIGAGMFLWFKRKGWFK